MITKKCTNCKQTKPLNEYHSSMRTKDGLMYTCASCNNEKSRLYRESLDKNEKYLQNRRAALKKNFGITLEQYQEMLDSQEGGCAVCGITPDQEGRALAVDHDHNTGEIYGLLCWFCNHKFVGRRREPKYYIKAAEYLQKGTGWFVPARVPSRKRKRKKKT